MTRAVHITAALCLVALSSLGLGLCAYIDAPVTWLTMVFTAGLYIAARRVL